MCTVTTTHNNIRSEQQRMNEPMKGILTTSLWLVTEYIRLWAIKFPVITMKMVYNYSCSKKLNKSSIFTAVFVCPPSNIRFI